jgi:alanine racemase
VVKADAYGHGMAAVAGALHDEGARTFAAGTIEECCELAEVLPDARIISLLGPVDGLDADLLTQNSVIPFVGSAEQMELAAEAADRRNTPLDISLKFDTGMSRLGFTLDDVPALLDRLKQRSKLRPVMASSHLACADEPNHFEHVREQGARFQAILDALRRAGLNVQGCLANSAGALAHGGLHHQALRPGIVLYGVNPFHKTPLEDLGRQLAPAMEVSAPVIQIRELPKGRTISYGASYTANRDMRAAVVAAGYADGYSRGLSNKGQVLIAGKRAGILGRVCMQLCIVDVTGVNGARPGINATLLGGEGPRAIRSEELAGWWETIPYEIFCMLGLNRKTYGN